MDQRKVWIQNLRPEWLVRKSEKSVENSRIEKKGTDPPGQRNQVVDQVNLGQGDEIRKSQMEQSREIFLNRYTFHKNL